MSCDLCEDDGAAGGCFLCDVDVDPMAFEDTTPAALVEDLDAATVRLRARSRELHLVDVRLERDLVELADQARDAHRHIVHTLGQQPPVYATPLGRARLAAAAAAAEVLVRELLERARSLCP